RAAGLGDFDLLAFGHDALLRPLRYAVASAGAADSSRRPKSSPTFLPRRVAALRGGLGGCSAREGALSILCGLEVPTDLATMSFTPKVSNTARIGPPAMMPVPAGAARRVTLPAPKRPLTS